MNNPLAVQELKYEYDFRQVESTVFECEGLWVSLCFITTGMQLQELGQVSSLKVLHNEAELFVCLERTVQCYDPWMFQVKEELFFDHDLILLPLLTIC